MRSLTLVRRAPSRCRRDRPREIIERSESAAHGDRSALPTLRRRRARTRAGPGRRACSRGRCSCSVPRAIRHLPAANGSTMPTSSTALQRGAAIYEKTFVDSLRRQVSEELDEQRRAPSPRSQGRGGLELMDESRVEVDIEISRAMQLIDSTAEWELRELQTFTSTLVGQQPRQRRIESVSAARLRDRALGRRVRDCRLADPARDRPAHVGRRRRRTAEERGRSGIDPARDAGRAARRSTAPSSCPRAPSFGRPVAEPPRPSAAERRCSPSMPLPTGPRRARRAAHWRRSRRRRAAPCAATARAGAAPSSSRRCCGSTSCCATRRWRARAPGGGSPGSRFEQHRTALVASASEPRRSPGDRAGDAPVRVAAAGFAAAAALSAGHRRACRSRRCVCAWPTARRSIRTSIRSGACSTASAQTSQGYSRIEDPRLSGFLAFAAAVAEEMAGASAPDTRAVPARPESARRPSFASSCRGSCAPRTSTVDALQVAERREILQQHLAQRITDQMVAVRTSPAIRRFVTGAWARVIAEDMLRHGEQSEATLSEPQDGRRPALEPEDSRSPAEPAAPDRAPARPAAARSASAWSRSPCPPPSSRPCSTS